MSIEVELNGKGGRVCEMARKGECHCPLIVRPTSEDVLTGNVFGVLKHIRPHLWLNPLLNQAIDGDRDSGRFRQVWFKDFTIKFWERQARFPPELLAFREGRTEPDVIIEWENPQTTVWLEAKYLSGFSTGTNNSDDNDQVQRGLRTLLADTGHIRPARLFDVPKRRPVWVALTMEPRPEEVVRYRGNGAIKAVTKAFAGGASLEPLLGHLTWRQLARQLREAAGGITPTERGMLESVSSYLDLKASQGRR